MVSPVVVSPTHRNLTLKAGHTPGLVGSGAGRPKLPLHLPVASNNTESPFSPSSSSGNLDAEPISELPNIGRDKSGGAEDVPPRPMFRKGYSKLNLQTLEGVESIKAALHAMRQDQSKKKKVTFAAKDEPIDDDRPKISQSKSSDSFLLENMASFASLRSHVSHGSNASSTSSVNHRVQGVGEITLSDLDVRFFHQQEERRQQLQHEIEIAALEKEVAAMKKEIKIASKDVWNEKEELTALQQKNWSIRKSLVRNPAPENSVTALNYKLEKLTRRDRQIEEDIDRIAKERANMDEECFQMTKAIQNMKLLMDGLHQKVVPLLTTSIAHQSFHDSRGSRLSLIDPKIIRDDELDDTIHSTDN